MVGVAEVAQDDGGIPQRLAHGSIQRCDFIPPAGDLAGVDPAADYAFVYPSDLLPDDPLQGVLDPSEAR